MRIIGCLVFSLEWLIVNRESSVHKQRVKAKMQEHNQLFRGLLQSKDGLITRVLAAEADVIRFQASFALSEPLIQRLIHQPEHLVFSERSRIARLGVQIKCEPPSADTLEAKTVTLTLTAASVISGYPSLGQLSNLFTPGFPVGRLAFCDPDALLSAGQVLEAIERAELKLPASTSISSDGRIVIAPHRVVYQLREPLDPETLDRILLWEEGRELLNRYQIRKPVSALIIAPGAGVVTTCSMYLNDHYVVLQSGFELGRHLPATILDPIKTRGIRIYLEIVNRSRQPIVNPLISAKIYRSAKPKTGRHSHRPSKGRLAAADLRDLERRFAAMGKSTCHFLDKPVAVIQEKGASQARLIANGPESPCLTTHAECAVARRDFSPNSRCPHRYATSRIRDLLAGKPGAIALKYFPNLIEHRDIVNLAIDGLVETLYFFEPSCEHGPFLSQNDHGRLQEYHAFGIDVHWLSRLVDRLMVHTMRDGKGYFVTPERYPDFHKSMLFAFYGSNQALSARATKRLGHLLDALINFWGKNIGIVTGGGSGVMEVVNTLARQRGILSGANFLDITDQSLTTEVDFCQVFQSKCRHSRQKWFEVASFPIFNVGGLGSLEELGITLCNMKLSILEPVPVILFDTEGDGAFWSPMIRQVKEMVGQHRAPAWIQDSLVVTNNPVDVVRAYRERLQLF
jgi:predicted Rossmann-fold nucleotide-binding protein